jgi:hypothetical protein
MFFFLSPKQIKESQARKRNGTLPELFSTVDEG